MLTTALVAGPVVAFKRVLFDGPVVVLTTALVVGPVVAFKRVLFDGSSSCVDYSTRCRTVQLWHCGKRVLFDGPVVVVLWLQRLVAGLTEGQLWHLRECCSMDQ